MLEPTKQKDKVENVRKKEEKKELKQLGQIRLQPGQTLWEVEVDGHNKIHIRKAKFESDVAFRDKFGKISGRRRLVQNSNCFYISALNLKNAVKKVNKMVTVSNNEKTTEDGKKEV